MSGITSSSPSISPAHYSPAPAPAPAPGVPAPGHDSGEKEAKASDAMQLPSVTAREWSEVLQGFYAGDIYGDCKNSPLDRIVYCKDGVAVTEWQGDGPYWKKMSIDQIIELSKAISKKCLSNEMDHILGGLKELRSNLNAKLSNGPKYQPLLVKVNCAIVEILDFQRKNKEASFQEEMKFLDGVLSQLPLKIAKIKDPLRIAVLNDRLKQLSTKKQSVKLENYEPGSLTEEYHSLFAKVQDPFGIHSRIDLIHGLIKLLGENVDLMSQQIDTIDEFLNKVFPRRFFFDQSIIGKLCDRMRTYRYQTTITSPEYNEETEGEVTNIFRMSQLWLNVTSAAASVVVQLNQWQEKRYRITDTFGTLAKSVDLFLLAIKSAANLEQEVKNYKAHVEELSEMIKGENAEIVERERNRIIIEDHIRILEEIFKNLHNLIGQEAEAEVTSLLKVVIKRLQEIFERKKKEVMMFTRLPSDFKIQFSRPFIDSFSLLKDEVNKIDTLLKSTKEQRSAFVSNLARAELEKKRKSLAKECDYLKTKKKEIEDLTEAPFPAFDSYLREVIKVIENSSFEMKNYSKEIQIIEKLTEEVQELASRTNKAVYALLFIRRNKKIEIFNELIRCMVLFLEDPKNEKLYSDFTKVYDKAQEAVHEEARNRRKAQERESEAKSYWGRSFSHETGRGPRPGPGPGPSSGFGWGRSFSHINGGPWSGPGPGPGPGAGFDSGSVPPSSDMPTKSVREEMQDDRRALVEIFLPGNKEDKPLTIKELQKMFTTWSKTNHPDMKVDPKGKLPSQVEKEKEPFEEKYKQVVDLKDKLIRYLEESREGSV